MSLVWEDRQSVTPEAQFCAKHKETSQKPKSGIKSLTFQIGHIDPFRHLILVTIGRTTTLGVKLGWSWHVILVVLHFVELDERVGS